MLFLLLRQNNSAFSAERSWPTCAVAITVRVADLNRVHLMMMQNRVPHLRMADVVRIPPSYAGNVVVDFTE